MKESVLANPNGIEQNILQDFTFIQIPKRIKLIWSFTFWTFFIFNSDFCGFSKWLKKDFFIERYFYYLSKSKLLLSSKSGTCSQNHWINCMNWQQIIWDSILAWLWYDRWIEVSYSISICPLGRSLLSHKLDPQQIRILIEQLPFYIFMLFSMKISFQNFYDLFEKFMKYIFQEVFGALVIDFRPVLPSCTIV